MMQRLHIYAGEDGRAHWAGLTPEALNQFGGQVTQPARLEIADAPVSAGFASSARREIMIVLCGVHEFGAAEGTRRLFPGDMIVFEDTSGQGHTFEAIGKEKAISLRFPLDA
jgi:hypothetical protein